MRAWTRRNWGPPRVWPLIPLAYVCYPFARLLVWIIFEVDYGPKPRKRAG